MMKSMIVPSWVAASAAVAVIVVTSMIVFHVVVHRKKEEGNGHEANLVIESCVSAEEKEEEPDDRSDTVLKSVYDRLENLFETSKPYLDSGLTIAEVSKILYTNKTYVSRALKRYSGKNFCQYVNEYRIRYSMDIFNENRNLKVNEVAHMSGFHSLTTFNFAFRSMMNQSPGEWFRKQRMEAFPGES